VVATRLEQLRLMGLHIMNIPILMIANMSINILTRISRVMEQETILTCHLMWKNQR
jgi:hypothetical protein